VPFPAAGGIAVVDGTVYAGWGWWLAGAPDDADGGLIAFRLDDTGDGGGLAAGGSGDGDRDRDQDDGSTGEDVYQRSCASCHGGSGEGSSGPSLVDVAERLSRDDHVAIVRDGLGKMPGWSGTLSPDEIEAVVDYEREVLSPGP
jgi:mono/diheme cytochrome c family protein